MKNKEIKKLLNKEVNSISFDESILTKIKTKSNIEDSFYTDDIVINSSNTAVKKRKLAIPFSIIGLFLLLVTSLLLIFLLPIGKSNPYSYLVIDINPSIELELDENNNVKSQKALNKDGAILLLNTNLVGKTHIEATKYIIEFSNKHNLIKNNDISLIYVNSEKEKETTLKNEATNSLNSFFNELDIKTSLLNINEFNEDIISAAKKNKVSAGTMYFLEQAKDINNSIDNLLNQPMNDIILKAKNFNEEELELFEEELENKLEELENKFEDSLDKIDSLKEDIEKLKDKCEKFKESSDESVKNDIIDLVNDLHTKYEYLLTPIYNKEDLENNLSKEQINAFILELQKHVIELDNLESSLDTQEDKLEEKLDNLKDFLLFEN